MESACSPQSEWITEQQAESAIPRNLAKRFAAEYGGAPRVFRAPGRVNLIGEHTDYNDGFVLPAAIDSYIWIAIGPRDDEVLELCSENLQQKARIWLDEPNPRAKSNWSDYVQGVVVMLQAGGIRVRGANLLIRSGLPSGAGLSSSAALEVSSGLALLAMSGQSLKLLDIAKLCQRAENDFVGMRCGIMDQFAACFGRAGHALLLDCRSLEYHPLPLPPGLSMVICNTMVKHEHAGGAYNARRAECEKGVRLLQQKLPGIEALRDVSLAELEAHLRDLPDSVYRRCRHVLTENARVLNTVTALRDGDLTALGKNLVASHRSLRDDFEVSCQELDVMVELALQSDGVLGARMTGGGFGGCTINFVHAEKVKAFCESVSTGYHQATGKTPDIYVSKAGAGAAEIAGH